MSPVRFIAPLSLAYVANNPFVLFNPFQLAYVISTAAAGRVVTGAALRAGHSARPQARLACV